MNAENYLLTYWIGYRGMTVRCGVKIPFEKVPLGFSKNTMAPEYRDFIEVISPPEVAEHAELVAVDKMHSIEIMGDA